LIGDLLSLLADITATFDALEIPWVLGGSLASSHYGEPRTTLDADVAIVSQGQGLVHLYDELRARYYVSESALSLIGPEGGSFNVVDSSRGVKVDIFVLGDGLLDRSQIARKVAAMIPGFAGVCWITAPEDVVLRKLSWWRDAGGSDRQWRDLVEVLRQAGRGMDIEYLHRTAQELGLESQLLRAIDDARPNDVTDVEKP
jgi:hypothetical protein